MSENNDFTFTNATLKAIYQDAAELRGVTELRGADVSAKLSELVHAKGFSMEKAVEISNRILAGVNSFDQIFSEVTEGRKAVAGKFSELSARDQLTLAENIRVIQAAMYDEKLQQAFQDGASLDHLRDEMFGSTNDMTDDEIKAFVDETLEEMDKMGLTEHAAKRMLASIKKNRKVLSAMRSIAAKDYDLKVCAALETYLSTDESVTVEDAVSMACTSVELHRVADDLDRGIITAKAARALILLIGLAATLYMIDIVFKSGLVAMAVPELGITMFIISLLVLMGIDFSSNELAKKLPLWVGWVSVKASDIGRQVVDESVRLSEKVAEAGHRAASAILDRRNAENDAENDAEDEVYDQVDDDQMNEVDLELS